MLPSLYGLNIFWDFNIRIGKSTKVWIVKNPNIVSPLSIELSKIKIYCDFCHLNCPESKYIVTSVKRNSCLLSERPQPNSRNILRVDTKSSRKRSELLFHKCSKFRLIPVLSTGQKYLRLNLCFFRILWLRREKSEIIWVIYGDFLFDLASLPASTHLFLRQDIAFQNLDWAMLWILLHQVGDEMQDLWTIFLILIATQWLGCKESCSLYT